VVVVSPLAIRGKLGAAAGPSGHVRICAMARTQGVGGVVPACQPTWLAILLWSRDADTFANPSRRKP